METLVKKLRMAQADCRPGLAPPPYKLAGLLGDAASRIEDLEDHVTRLEHQLADQGRPFRG